MASTPKDPMDMYVNPAPSPEAAGYLIEMLSSMSHFAHMSDLNNSSIMLAAAAQVIDQECRLLNDAAPVSSAGEGVTWPFPYLPNGSQPDDPQSSDVEE